MLLHVVGQISPPLPKEVCVLILEQLYGMKIQGCVLRMLRRRRFEHRLHPKWSCLRQRLTQGPWQSLERYCDVRKEWRREPESWIFEIDQRGSGLLSVILRECREGLWGPESPI